jgi:N6-adenosine-specific RNA methylase IME4
LSERQTGDAHDKVAAHVGISGRTEEKAKAVVDAAEVEPEKFGKLQEDMDRTGRVNGVSRRLKIAKHAEQVRTEPPPLPGNGPYRVGIIDFPWPYEKRDADASHRAARPYPTTSITAMRALPVPSIMHDDSILWFWTTNHHMREALEIANGWGFEIKTILTWAKDKIGTGDWLRGQTEHRIMAVRGKPIVSLTNQSTLLRAPSRGHSVKPKEFYDLVESLCPAPRYADLFSRYRHNEGWDCHGDEAPVTPASVENIEKPAREIGAQAAENNAADLDIPSSLRRCEQCRCPGTPLEPVTHADGRWLHAACREALELPL